MQEVNQIPFLIFDESNFWAQLTLQSGTLPLTQPTNNPALAAVCLLLIRTKDDLTANTAIIHQYASKCLIISFFDNDDNLQEIIAKYPIHYLLSADSPSLRLELSLAIASILQIFLKEVTTFLNMGEKIFTKSITEKKELRGLLQQNSNRFDFSEFFHSPLQYLEAIINELVTNAIYNAPRGPDHHPSYRHLPRQTNLKLQEHETVLLEIYTINKNIIITVEDCFGELEYTVLQSALGRAVQEKAPCSEGQGAGIGLFLVYRYSNLLMVELHPQRKTKIYVMIEATKKFKQYQSRITSFLFHHQLHQGVGT